MRVATWNVQWAGPRSTRGARVKAKLLELHADVLIVTEGLLGVLPAHGHLIDAGNSWGYGEKRDRRKVLAWSKRPWREPRRVDEGAGTGRVVAAVTDTDDGLLAVIGVCVPWRDAHVQTGRRDARRWEEHVACCAQLVAVRRTFAPGIPTLIAGDYNQRIPRAHQPLHVVGALNDALVGMTVWTGGDTRCGLLIDHVAGSPGLALDSIDVWAARDAEGPLSDHTGVACNAHTVRPD